MPSGLHPLTRAFPDVGALNSPGLQGSGDLEPGRLKQTPRFVHNFGTTDWKGPKEDLVKIPWDTIYLMSSVVEV